jgi:hypothetical protein
MGYDRYVAICQPLHYNVLMSPHGCACLVAWSWVGGSVMGIVVTTAIFNLTFCGPNEIHHFACLVPPVLKLVCGKDVLVVAKVLGLVCISALLDCFLLLLLSYAFIVAAILRIPSAEGRHKAFSTCASHLTVVILHYGFASVIYLKPNPPPSSGRRPFDGHHLHSPHTLPQPHQLQSQEQGTQDHHEEDFAGQTLPRKFVITYEYLNYLSNFSIRDNTPSTHSHPYVFNSFQLTEPFLDHILSVCTRVIQY